MELLDLARTKLQVDGNSIELRLILCVSTESDLSLITVLLLEELQIIALVSPPRIQITRSDRASEVKL